MAAGMLAVAGVVCLQANRYAFTRLATSSNPAEQTNVTEEPGPAQSARTGSSVAAVILTTQAPPSVAPVILPEVLITVLGPRVRTIAVPGQGETLVPCTAWRDLGPVSIAPNDPEPVEQHRVQMLCPEGEEPPLLEPSS
jgi:hypothetical protein